MPKVSCDAHDLAVKNVAVVDDSAASVALGAGAGAGAGAGVASMATTATATATATATVPAAPAHPDHVVQRKIPG